MEIPSDKVQSARRVEIPKENGKTRPLSIYCYEDKLVQEALRQILEAVFEPHFYDEMMGFNHHRGCHGAIRKLNEMIERKRTNYVLDADIKGFFNHLDHEWAVKFIESKIKDPNITSINVFNYLIVSLKTLESNTVIRSIHNIKLIKFIYTKLVRRLLKAGRYDAPNVFRNSSCLWNQILFIGRGARVKGWIFYY
jgi:retron-type reverse transcriptase